MANYYIADGEDEKVYSVETLSEGVFKVTNPAGETFEIDAFMPMDGRLNFVMNNRSLDFDVREFNGEKIVQRRGLRTNIEVLNERQRRMRVAGVGGKKKSGPDLTSPMAGKVVAIQCAVGDETEEGQVLVIVEAMKMENDLKAHMAGSVVSIQVSVGDAVEVGDVLVTLEAAEE